MFNTQTHFYLHLSLHVYTYHIADTEFSVGKWIVWTGQEADNAAIQMNVIIFTHDLWLQRIFSSWRQLKISKLYFAERHLKMTSLQVPPPYSISTLMPNLLWKWTSQPEYLKSTENLKVLTNHEDLKSSTRTISTKPRHPSPNYYMMTVCRASSGPIGMCGTALWPHRMKWNLCPTSRSWAPRCQTMKVLWGTLKRVGSSVTINSIVLFYGRYRSIVIL